MAHTDFIPAAHWHVLTRWYEPLTRPILGRVWRRVAQDLARIAPPGGAVVDLGCGPGTILRVLRRRRSDLVLVGRDVDPAIVRVAQRRSRDLDITFEVASIEALDWPAQSVDVVTSSLMFHHLPRDIKEQTFAQVRRVLKPDGVFLLADASTPTRRMPPPYLWFVQAFEPEVRTQMDGELQELGRLYGAECETLWTVYGFVSMHVYRFPA